MNSQDSAHPLDRLVPEVATFTTERFVLRDDLDHLYQVQRVGAPEAVILYSARILEVLAAEALKAVKLPSSANVLSNLDALQQFNLMPATTRYWAHALRRTGNQARHILRAVKPEDAEWSVLWVERWLDWFFSKFRYGRLLPSLTLDQGLFKLNSSDELRALMQEFDDGKLDRHIPMMPGAARGNPSLLATPALPAVLAEMLLDRNENKAACAVLEQALVAFPDDLRVRQLMGLYWGRTGNLTEALPWLEAIYDQYPDDEETAGLMAGVYKRRWMAATDNSDWLAKSHRAYRRGWDRSKKNNAYLGINAATTSLWLERPAEARQLAAQVEKLLRDRAVALAAHNYDRDRPQPVQPTRPFVRAAFLAAPNKDPDLVFNFWDQVTLAEALLLQGNFTAARPMYLDAYAKHPEQEANIQVSRNQMGEILRALGLPVDVEGFLEVKTQEKE